MRPGSWLDGLLFAFGSTASAWGAIAWDTRAAQASPHAHVHLTEAFAFTGVASFVGALVYRAAQRRRLKQDVLFPRRWGHVTSAGLGVGFAVLWLSVGSAVDATLGGLGHAAIACLLPWGLSRAQWTATPPESV